MFDDTDIISDPCFPEGYQLSVSGPLSQQFAHLRLFLFGTIVRLVIKVLGERAAGSLGSR